MGIGGHNDPRINLSYLQKENDEFERGESLTRVVRAMHDSAIKEIFELISFCLLRLGVPLSGWLGGYGNLDPILWVSAITLRVRCGRKK